MLGPERIPEELEDPRCFAVNARPPRAASWPARTRLVEAEQFLADIDDFRINLGGRWQFHWSPDPGTRPVGFQDPGFDASGWGEIQIPCNSELEGYGIPVYSNYEYPFKVDPPRVMEEPPSAWTSFHQRNPVGSCRKTFEVPTDWRDRKIILHLAGVQSAALIWVNGHYVGYREDSMSAFEYDITGALQEGSNLLAIQTFAFCSGSYLEDQDFWRLTGIFRDVYLYSVSPIHLEDISVQSEPEGSRGRVSVVAQVWNEGLVEADGYTAGIQVRDMRSGHLQEVWADVPRMLPGELREISLLMSLDTVRFWTSETPELYPVTVILQKGREDSDIRHFRSGFRRMDIKNRVFLHNGVPVKLRGVNRHEHHPRWGRVPQVEAMARAWSLPLAGSTAA